MNAKPPGSSPGDSFSCPSPNSATEHKLCSSDGSAEPRQLSRGALLLEQLRRRHEAAKRLSPLPHSGQRDPLSFRERSDCRERPCRCTEPLSDCAIDGWADAARHVLITCGQMPLLPIEVRRALWRRGGADRALAELLHRGCGGRLT